MSLSPELISYIHLHQLTRDEEWTCDLANKLITKLHIPFPIPPSNDSDLKFDLIRIFDGLGPDSQPTLLDHVESIVGEHWSISKTQMSEIKTFVIQLYQPNATFNKDWWDGQSQIHKFTKAIHIYI